MEEWRPVRGQRGADLNDRPDGWLYDTADAMREAVRSDLRLGVSTAAEHVALSAVANVALGGEPVRTPWPPAGSGGAGESGVTAWG